MFRQIWSLKTKLKSEYSSKDGYMFDCLAPVFLTIASLDLVYDHGNYRSYGIGRNEELRILPGSILAVWTDTDQSFFECSSTRCKNDLAKNAGNILGNSPLFNRFHQTLQQHRLSFNSDSKQLLKDTVWKCWFNRFSFSRLLPLSTCQHTHTHTHNKSIRFG